jgi:colanic acid/amylovoran biosynthesis glycosyltransferase
MPSRLLYVLFRYPETSQTFVRDEIWALRSAGLTVDVISLDEPQPGVDRSWGGPVAVPQRARLVTAALDHLWFLARFPRRYLAFLRIVVGHRDEMKVSLRRVPSHARALVSLGGYGQCHTHFAWSSASVAGCYARLLGCPASITVHAKDIYTVAPGKLARRLACFERVATVCQYNVGFLAGRGATDLADPRVVVLPCCVHLPPAHPDNGGEDRDILAVGRLVPKKGFDALLRAVAELGGVTLTVVGEGPERAALERLAAELGLGGMVRFQGALSHADTLDAIAACSVLCLPARRSNDGDMDAMPVVLREAMARGIPVIATALGGIPETVDSEVGWLVAPDAPAELRQALGEAMADEGERRRRGAAGRRRVAAHWTLDAHGRRFLDAVLLDPPGAAAA